MTRNETPDPEKTTEPAPLYPATAHGQAVRVAVVYSGPAFAARRAGGAS
jgi:hypothetical protein